MKFFLALAALIIIVLLCDRFEEKLPTPIAQAFALWKKFSHVLGIVMSFLILTVLWIVGFGIYAIIIKILSLPKRCKAIPKTYWVDAEKQSLESMRHQF